MENGQQEACPCRCVNCPGHDDCAACREYHHVSGRKPLSCTTITY